MSLTSHICCFQRYFPRRVNYAYIAFTLQASTVLFHDDKWFRCYHRDMVLRTIYHISVKSGTVIAQQTTKLYKGDIVLFDGS